MAKHRTQIHVPQTATMTFSPLPHNCEACQDTGYLGWKTPEAGYSLSEIQFCKCDLGQKASAYWQRRSAAARARQIEALFVGAGIPPHFRDMTLDTLSERAGKDKGKQAAIAAARDYMAQGYILDTRTSRYKSGLVLSGDFGRGKTGLLTPVLRHFVEQGKAGLWIEFYDFITQIQQGYSDGKSNERLDAAQKADIILLDDLGDKERLSADGAMKGETDDRRRILYQLINYRHNHALPTLITTNLMPSEIADQFGARTLERIVESCAWISMGGKNLRTE